MTQFGALLRALSEAGVECIVIGGTPENIDRLVRAFAPCIRTSAGPHRG